MYYDWVVIRGLACQVQEPQRGRGQRGRGAGRVVDELHPILFGQNILIQIILIQIFGPTSDTSDDIYVHMF